MAKYNENLFIEDIKDLLKINRNDKINVVGCVQYGMKYCSDYDLYSVSNSLNKNQLIRNIKNLINRIIKEDQIITDIKLGTIEEFRILKPNIYISKDKNIINYNYNTSKNKIQELYNNDIITEEKFNEYNKLLKEKPTIKDYYLMKAEFKEHIIRWKPKEIIKGHKNFKGIKVHLKDCITSPEIFKIDILYEFKDFYELTEISCIYELRINNKRINLFIMNLERNLKNDVLIYSNKKMYYKALKRLYSLYYHKKDNIKMNKIKIILNNDEFGNMYLISSMIDNLIMFIEENEKNRTKKFYNYIIEFIKDIINNIRELKNFNNIKKYIRINISDIEKLTLIKDLTKLKDNIMNLLNKQTKREINKNKIKLF